MSISIFSHSHWSSLTYLFLISLIQSSSLSKGLFCAVSVGLFYSLCVRFECALCEKTIFPLFYLTQLLFPIFIQRPTWIIREKAEEKVGDVIPWSLTSPFASNLVFSDMKQEKCIRRKKRWRLFFPSRLSLFSHSLSPSFRIQKKVCLVKAKVKKEYELVEQVTVVHCW